MRSTHCSLSVRNRACRVLVSIGSSLVCLLRVCAPVAGQDSTPAQLAAAEARWKKRNPFYKKHIVVGGMLIMSSEKVSDAALSEAAKLTGKMLAGRPDILKAMIERRGRVMVVGVSEGITDLPEYAWMRPKEFWNKRSRGFGGGGRKVNTSVAEENLLGLPVDLYEEECIFIHEFAHTIHQAINLSDKDRTFDKKLKETYEGALKKGLWRCPYKDMYAAVNYKEYWAEGVQSWFDANNENNFKHNHVNTREELKAYDPDLAKLIDETFRLTKETDWRYKPLVKRPQVTAPAESLKCDPFYKKEVWARGLPILSSQKVSDEALLEANRIARHMFAYRHDIFTAMIDDGLRLVVVGANERIKDIPELKGSQATKDRGKASRILRCTPQRKMIACGEENLLNRKADPHAGESVLIGELARAVHVMAGHRPVDEKLAKALEQYKNVDRRRRSSVRILRCKIGVKPIDKRFDEKLRQLHKNALGKGLWRNTLAAANHGEYWAEGVQSWFDANGQDCPGHNHVNTRKKLEAYDPDLAKLIAEVFRHTDRVDWRYKLPAAR